MNKKGFAHVLILLAGIVVVGVAAVSFLAGKGFSGSVFLPSEPSPSTAQTSDPIAEWETYQGESLLFRHPEGWSVTKGSVEYYGGEAVLIKNPKKTVTLTVYPAINNTYPYGFGNPEIQKDIVKVMFGGKSYDVEEITVDNRALYAEVVNDGKYSFLFGTGYPSGASELASLEDYNRDKNTILQILSTFEFTNPASTEPVKPTASPPAGWIKKAYPNVKTNLYLPPDWVAKFEEFPETESSLISMKKSSWNSYPVQLNVKKDWSNMGDQQYLERSYPVANGVKAVRIDPPKKENMVQERYQTDFYFEANSRVYAFHCVHNWEQDTLETCENVVKNIEVNK